CAPGPPRPRPEQAPRRGAATGASDRDSSWDGLLRVPPPFQALAEPEDAGAHGADRRVEQLCNVLGRRRHLEASNLCEQPLALPQALREGLLERVPALADAACRPRITIPRPYETQSFVRFLQLAPAQHDPAPDRVQVVTEPRQGNVPGAQPPLHLGEERRGLPEGAAGHL